MKRIVFSVAVLCAVVAQAVSYDKYTWQPTTGGEFSTVDDTKGWKKDGTCSNYDSYYLQTAQSAALTLSNDWTLAGWLDVKTASNVFDFGTSTLTVAKGFNVEQGGGLLFKSGTINSQSSIQVLETKNGTAAESLTIDNATLQTTGHFYHKTTTDNDCDSVVMITNHAVLSTSNSFFTEGGSPNAHVFIADHSSLTAKDLGTGRGWSGYADGGRGGTVTFADHSTGTFTGNAMVGVGVPNTWLEILSGSEVTNNALYVGSSTASSNNLVKVDNATLTINHIEYLYLGGKTTYSCDNTLLVTNSGVLNFKGACVGYLGSGNRLIVTGPGSTATSVASGGKPLYIGRDSAAVCGTNAVIVTDHAQLTVSNSVYVGYSSAGINPDAGLENRLEVTDGATANLMSGVLVCPGSSIQTKDATISFASVPRLYHDTRCAFVDSTVSFTKTTENVDFGGLGAEYSDTEICFTNSTVKAGRIRLGSTNIVLRLYDSTMTCNGALHTTSTAQGQNVSAGCTIVFGGTNAQLTVTQYSWFPNAKLRFEIPKAGYPTNRPIMTATDANKGFWHENIHVPRTVEVVIHPKCPSGTYTLLKGTNATHSDIVPTLNYDPTRTRAEIVKKIGDDELQVKVERIMKGLAVIVK